LKEFDYHLPYTDLDFTQPAIRSLYRIGRGEQGVLLVRPYTNVICQHWRFKTPKEATKSAKTIYKLFEEYISKEDFIGADMARKFLEMGFTRSRRYANHHSGRKYNQDRTIKPQESDHATCHYAESATVFLQYRRLAAENTKYKTMRKQWRDQE
jgi:hypothetical protein